MPISTNTSRQPLPSYLALLLRWVVLVFGFSFGYYETEVAMKGRGGMILFGATEAVVIAVVLGIVIGLVFSLVAYLYFWLGGGGKASPKPLRSSALTALLIGIAVSFVLNWAVIHGH